MIVKRLDIALTTKCNFTCKYCRGNPGQRNRMPLEDVLAILDNFREFNLRSVRLDGGEPFLYGKEIFSIFEYGKRNGLNIGVYTNAGLLTKIIIDKLSFYYPIELLVTLHTLNKRNEIESTLRGLGRLSESNIFPDLILIVSRKHIPAVREILAQLPNHPYTITFRPIIPVGKAFENWEEGFSSLQKDDLEHFSELFETLKTAFPSFSFVNSLPGPNQKDGYHKKEDGYVFHVDTDGILLPSFAARSDRFMGSALNKKSIMKRLTDPALQTYLENADAAIMERIRSTEKPSQAEIIVNQS